MVEHYGILLVLGVSAFVGILGAWTFQRLRIPQVVGYIVIGLVVGRTGIGLIDAEHLRTLEPFTYFALGIIGFLVGGELKLSEFHKYGRQFASILLAEGLLAFLLVGAGTGLSIYYVCGSLPAALAGGVVFGAIASATDPASTVDVLWEYRSKGVLTIAIIAIVALDDALAMTLYSVGKSVATILAGGSAPVLVELRSVTGELGGAVGVGILAGLGLSHLLRRIHDKDKALAVSICTLLLVIGLSVSLGLDVILSAMTLGFVVTNRAPLRSSDLFHMARSMSTPIYVLFFVLVGARLNVSAMPAWIWGLVVIYVVGRSLGKLVGAWLGAKASNAEESVRKFCGMGLFAQGGVAVGLSIVAGKNLQGLSIADGVNLGDGVVAVVTATTLIVQVVGPAAAKLAIKLSGEIGRNVTEDDILATLSVADAMRPENVQIHENDSVREVVDAFAESGTAIQSVSDDKGRLVGVISFDSLRDVLPDQESWQWLLATDVMTPPIEPIAADTNLLDAMRLMRDTGREELLVCEEGREGRIAGVVERRHIQTVARQKALLMSG